MCETKTQKILQDEQCFEIIRKKLRKDAMDDFSLVGYEIVPIEEVNGFLGQYFMLKATVACPKSPLETKSINFFTKLPPPIDSLQYSIIQECRTFKKEVDIYTTVFPEILGSFDRRYIPECFLGVEDDVIVLEDMTQSGYIMTDKSIPFDFEHCVIIMKTIAKFHAKSFVFERQHKKTMHDKFSYCMHESLYPRHNTAKELIDAGMKGIISIIDLLPGLNNDQRVNFKERIVKLCADHIDNMLPSTKYKNVLCHGDLWANNIMFKYGNDGRPIACCLVDFQLSRYNPPVHDVLTFLQFTTIRKLRDEHSETLFKIYYDSMTSTLKEDGLNISEVFPWEEFVESIQDLRTVCMMQGILNTPVMLMMISTDINKQFSEQPEFLKNILLGDRTPLLLEQFKKDPEFRTRMMDNLLELHDRIAG